MAGAALVVAEIVWMLRAGLAGRPAGRQRVIAIASQHEAPQWEVGIDV